MVNYRKWNKHCLRPSDLTIFRDGRRVCSKSGHRREFTAPHIPVDLGITYIFLNKNAPVRCGCIYIADYINNGNFFTSANHEYP
jgi:hypothetical protein